MTEKVFIAGSGGQGIEMSGEEMEQSAERAFTLERVMLARAGRGRPIEERLAFHFTLPCRDDGTRVDEAGFARLMDEYYDAREDNRNLAELIVAKQRNGPTGTVRLLFESRWMRFENLSFDAEPNP